MSIGPAYGSSGGGVSFSNPVGALYVKGSEFVDGSIRFVTNVDQDAPLCEHRQNGIWAATGLSISAEQIELGTDVSLGAVGSHLQVTSRESVSKSLLLETRFDDAGTEIPHTHILGPRQNRVVFSPNEVGEIVTDLFELPVTSFSTAFRYQYYFKTGSVAATQPVTMTLSKGQAPGGLIVFTQTMPASQWAASVEVVIVLVGAISLTVNAPLLLTIESDADFSLIGDAANGGNFFAMDFQPFALQDVIDIPTGTDRFTFDRLGEITVDRLGNPVMAGRQGSLSTTAPLPAFPPLSDPPI